MARKCKCQICKKQLNTDIAYKIIKNNKNLYYCSKEEYDNNIKEQEIKRSCLDYIANNENNSEFGKVRYIFTIIQNNINKSAKDYKEEQEKMKSLFKKENDIDIELINKLDNKNNKINNIHDISNFLD